MSFFGSFGQKQWNTFSSKMVGVMEQTQKEGPNIPLKCVVCSALIESLDGTWDFHVVFVQAAKQALKEQFSLFLSQP